MISKLIGWLYIPPEERIRSHLKFRCLTCGNLATLDTIESEPCATCAREEKKRSAPPG